MKHLTKFAFLAAVFGASLPLLSAATTAPAETSTPAKETAPATVHRPARRAHALQRHARRTHAQQQHQLQRIRKGIAHQLKLSAEQHAQLQSIRTSARHSLRTLRHDPAVPVDQKRTKARELRQTTRTQMRALLTVEQQARLDEIKAAFRDPLGGS